MIPFIGYAPDLDPTTPGIITNCSAIIPTIRGYKGAPAPASQSVATLGGQCYGAALIRKNDDTTRLIAGTSSTLKELSTGSWTSRTPDAAGSTLNGLGTTDFWCFAQFGDAILATAKTEIPKFLDSATTFANVTASAPKAAIVEVANNFTLLFDVNDQGALFDSANRPNGWWCAAKGGYTSYTPSGASEAATGTLHSSPGKITAGKAFGYQVIAYKLRSMYLGTYVGAPVIWDFQLIPGEAGALCNTAVVNVGTPEQPRHIFMGYDNFYQFAGGQAIPIGNPIKEAVFGELDYNNASAVRTHHDRKGKIVRFYYPVSGGRTPDKCVVYNYITGKWGRDDRVIQASVDYASAGITYDNLGSSYATFDALPNLPFDTAFLAAAGEYPAIFDTTNSLVTLTGPSSQASITTGDYGDPQMFSTVTRVIPQFFSAPNTAQMTNYYRNNLSDALTTGQTVTMSNGRFDVLRSARWHRARFDMTGDFEIVGFDPQANQDGEE